MGVFGKNKNKKFSYTPRFYDDKGEGSPFEMKHKFDDYRKTIGGNIGLKTKINNALDEFKETPDRVVNRRLLIIIIVLLFLFLYIIDFDLSIFFSKN